MLSTGSPLTWSQRPKSLLKLLFCMYSTTMCLVCSAAARWAGSRTIRGPGDCFCAGRVAAAADAEGAAEGAAVEVEAESVGDDEQATAVTRTTIEGTATQVRPHR